MENLALMLTQPWMVSVFVSVILIVALRPLYQAIVSIATVNQDLSKATHVLTELGRNQQDEFYNQFKHINTQILKIPGLRHAWREFVDSMYFESVTSPNVHKKVYLSHRPSHYFNRESVLGTRLNIAQFLAYPNYLIGIGLTFTFIGLAAALHVAQEGLASGAGQQALKDLLAVASIKFISSIVGIASSLFISALQRFRIRIFQQKLDAFCDLLEECTKYKSAEKLLHDSFSEQHKQTLILNDMAGNIAGSISDAIGARLSGSIANGLAPLTEDIRQLAQHFAEGSDITLRKMLAEFLSQLRGSSVEDMQGLMGSVRMLQESLDGLAAKMEAAGRHLGSDTKASTTHMTEILDNFTASFTTVQRSMSQFGQSLQSLDTVAGTIGQAGDSIAAAAEGSKKSAGEFGKAMEGISTAFTPLSGLLPALSQSLAHTKETAQEFQQAGGTIASAADGFKRSADQIQRSEDQFKETIRLFESVAQSMAATVAVLERMAGQASAALPQSKEESRYFAKLKSKWRK